MNDRFYFQGHASNLTVISPSWRKSCSWNVVYNRATRTVLLNQIKLCKQRLIHKAVIKATYPVTARRTTYLPVMLHGLAKSSYHCWRNSHQPAVYDGGINC